MELKDDFDKALEPRNNSLLAHGYQPIGKDKYENLKKLVLELLAEMDVREEEIPKFATFTLDALLCEPESETAQQTI